MPAQRNILILFFFLHWYAGHGQITLYVSNSGNNNDPGTLARPYRTLDTAVAKALQYTGMDVTIELRHGYFYLDKTIEIMAGNYFVRSLSLRPFKKEKVVISGSKVINLQWKSYKNGILKASLVLEQSPDRLFLNGKALPMARYPDYDASARVFNGTAADAFSNEKVKRWSDPSGGYIHALHSAEWGDFHYRISGKDANGKIAFEGGWQNNRPSSMHNEYRFVENIFEELDAPGEWFYDRNKKMMYLYPPGMSIRPNATFTIGNLTDLIHIIGDSNKPVKNISISNLHFTQTSRSFMLTKEPLLRSDWRIYRGGAILLQRTENVSINHCSFSELGGNAVCLSKYNKGDSIRNNHIHDIGASALVFVGNPDAVRSPAFRYELFVPWNQMDFTPGPKNNDYPQYCVADGNLIHDIGNIEKQVAGVQIAMAGHITVSRNTIYKTPRAGINIGDGCWGGHLLEFNDIFNTVLETGDHGAFNAWGRDRFWRPEREIIDSIVAARPGIALLDATEPVTIRNNRFQCDHGWDIDLDDGSSNYRIYNNVCLNGGLKLREGYYRQVTNNIIVNNTFHPHVWLKNSRDTFMHNIVTAPYAPILMDNWGDEIDENFFLSKDGLDLARAAGLDSRSLWGDPKFTGADTGNYRVKPGSPALKTGFINFKMHFGVYLPALKKIAKKPAIRPLLTSAGKARGSQVEWLGAKLKNIENLGERSAAGLADEHGALLIALLPGSVAAKNGLQKGDVIIKMGDQPIRSISDLLEVYQRIKWMGGTSCNIVRNQSTRKLDIVFK